MIDGLRPRSLFLSVLVVAGGGALAAGHSGLSRGVAAPAPPAPARALVSALPPTAAAGATAPQRATGTIDLPALPQGISADSLGTAGDPSIRPAPPFVLRGTLIDQARALQCLTTAIYYEAANEPDDGQRAVAQVVLNRVRHPAFPATVCGVVFQGADRPVCQFSFACDGAMARRPQPAAWSRARRVAMAALDGSVFAPVGLATHYHTYAVTPSWNRSLVMTGVFGAHFFHRWKGWWGTPAAFRDRYAGGEPAPLVAQAQIASSAVPVQPRSTEFAASEVVPEPAAQSAVSTPSDAPRLPDSHVLEQWRDSGKLLHPVE